MSIKNIENVKQILELEVKIFSLRFKNSKILIFTIK